jgi:hypothetical protein
MEPTYRKRLTIELRAEEEAFIRTVHSRAVAQGLTLREWVLAAIREKAARDG